ncbi:MAG: hypothetical protein JNL92_24240 [Opitutaceae bacterium]|nr:hypothetical protein [Opitutaceae bacterium]
MRLPRAILPFRLILAVILLAVPAGAADPAVRLSAADTTFLDDLQRRAVRYFEEQADPLTGLVRDRAPVNGGISAVPSSVAATGFGLSAWCVAESRGWMTRDEVLRRVRGTLRFVLAGHAQERGWYYHFVDAATGRRAWDSEASTIDTALLLKGALLAREHLRDPEVTRLVDQLYARIDWPWALNGGATLSHGWRPETGFIPHRWDSYAELLGLYLLGIGAPTGALPETAWRAWRREPWVNHAGRDFIQCGPLFTHQYAQAWFDFRGRRDGQGLDYWQNSVDATLAQREWSAAQRHRFPHWSRDFWGLTASDSAHGYQAWGTPLPGGAADDLSDGTVVPSAPGGSLPFAPTECLAALRRMKAVGGDQVWGRYGFVDAFNPETRWASPDVIGISVGITLLMAENLRSGLVWRTFMRAPEVQRGMKRAGFHEPEPRSRQPVMATVGGSVR